MSLGFYLKVIISLRARSHAYRNASKATPESRVGTMPNARKNPYLVLDFYIQDWRWIRSIFNSYPCDLVSSY